MHPRIPTRKLSTLQATIRTKRPITVPYPQPPFTVMRSISTSRSLIDCPMKMRSESHSLSSRCRWPDITTEPRGGVPPQHSNNELLVHNVTCIHDSRRGLPNRQSTHSQSSSLDPDHGSRCWRGLQRTNHAPHLLFSYTYR